jgi:DNA invertase Pin-like site-specific DNA recombinase
MRVGYIRTSKKDQNPDLKRRELEADGCEWIFEEQISSRKAERPQLRAAPEYCREGDELVVWKRERTMAGLEAARARGHKGSRKSTLSDAPSLATLDTCPLSRNIGGETTLGEKTWDPNNFLTQHFE